MKGKMAGNKKRVRKVMASNKKCAFCESKTVPKWSDYEKLRAYLSVRGRIQSAKMSGTCVKHQKVLARAIKQARHLGLLPFVTLTD